MARSFLICSAALSVLSVLACSSSEAEVLLTPAEGAKRTDGAIAMGGALGGTGILKAEDCRSRDPSLEDADPQELFDYPHVPSFDFFLPAKEWALLKENAQDEVYAEAEACFEGRLLGRVGLRFKGAYGSLYGCFEDDGTRTCPKLSMKVKFSEVDPELRFFGRKRLNFNANQHDDSRIKERLAYDLYRQMGIVAPRAAWAVLRVNGEAQGLYGMVEQIDGRFTADRWPDNPNANVYKEVWPTSTEASAEDIVSGLRTNEETEDISAFRNWVDALQSATEEELLSVVGQYVDLDYMARYSAVDDAIASYDGISYFWTDGVDSKNHNFYFYEDAPDHFTLIPWDVESTFWVNPDHEAPHWTVQPEDCSLTYGYWEGLAHAPACDPMTGALGSDLTAWRAAAQELLDGPFSVQSMQDAIDRHAAFIAQEAAADPTPDRYQSFDNAVDGLSTTVIQLRSRLMRLVRGSR